MKTFNLLLTYFLTQLYPVAPVKKLIGELSGGDSEVKG